MFTEAGRTGAYLAVVEGGTVRPGDAIVVTTHEDGRLLVEVFRSLTNS